MADYKRIGAKIVIEGETEYKEAMKNAKASTLEFKSELKKLSTEFADNEKSIESLRKKQEAYIKQQEDLEKSAKTISQRIEEAIDVRNKEAAALEKNRKDHEELAKELEKAKELYGENSKEVADLQAKYEASTKEINNQELALLRLDTQITGYNTDLNNTENELNRVQKEIEQTNKELEESEKKFSLGGKAVEAFKNGTDIAGGKIKGFNEQFKQFVTMTAANLASDAIRGITRGLADMATSAIETGKAFESSMATVSATMALTDREIITRSGRYKILEDAAREMGATTKYSASEAAEALNYLALAGYDAEKAAQALPTVLNLAAAGAMDLGYASDLVTDSMSALGIQMDELEGFTDQMAVTAQKSNTNVSQLGEAILVVGGTAKQLAGGTVELNTALGILADNGIKGAEGGTALRNVLKNLLTPTEKAQIAMDKLHFSAYDADGSIRPLNETMKELASRLDGMSDRERNEVLNKIFDVRNLKSAEALMANAGKRFDELSGYISNADGAAARMAYTMSNTLEGRMKTFQSSAEELGISIYQRLEQPLKNATDVGTEGIRTLTSEVNNGRLGASLDQLGFTIEDLAEKGVEIATDMLPELIDGASWLTDNLEDVITAVKGLIATYATYEATTKVVTIATEVFGKTLNATPIGLAIAAVTGLIVVLNDLDDEMDETAQRTKDQADTLNAITSNLENVTASGDDLISSLETQKEVTDELLNELDELNQQEELNEEEKRRIQDIVQMLNGQYQGLNLQIDESTGKTTENTDAIRESVEELRKLEASQKIYEHIIESQDAEFTALVNVREAEKQLQKAQEERDEVVRQLNEREAQYNQNLEDNYGFGASLNEMTSDLTDREADLTEQINSLNTAIDNCNEEYTNAQERTSIMKDIMEEQTGKTFEQVEAENQLAESMAATMDTAGELTDDISGLGDEVDGLTDSMNEADEAFAKFLEDYSENISSALKGATDVFNEFKEAEEQDIGAMQENVRKHIDGIMEWRDSYTELANKVGTSADDVLQYLAGMGVDGKGYIDAMLQLSDEELVSFIADMETALTLPDNVTADIVNSYIGASQKICTSLSGSLHQESDGSVKEAVIYVGKGLSTQIENELRIHNYKSGVMYDEGVVIAKSLASGVDDNKGDTERATREVADAIEQTSRDELSSSNFEEIGEQVDRGLANGILYNDDLVYDAIRRVCDRAVEEAYRSLDINSPSKVFEEIGEYTGEGFVKGWDSKADEMVGSVNAVLGNAVPGAAKNEIDSHNISVGAPVINVYGAQGQDINQLADIIGDRWNLWMHQAAGVWR